MATGVSFSGLSTGIDTDSIISAMTQTETARKSALVKKQNALKLRQTAYTALRTGMSSVSRAAGALNSPTAFNTVKATSSDEAVATISATTSASAGSFELEVTQLAKANKIASTAQADTSTPLGKAGTASVNGKAFKIESGDSLAAIAKKVNTLGAGVTASVVDGGAGRGYLTFTSSSTGSASAVSVSDLDGTALADLGITKPSSTVRDGGKSFAFSSKSTSLQSVLGTTGLPPSTITVDGHDVSVDPSTDTLDDVAAKINAAGGNATVQADSKDGATVYRLQVAGTVSEAGGLMKGLGVLRADAGNELVVGQDAKFKLDGVALTSSTNTTSSAIAGATVTLKKIGTSSVELAKDTAGIKTGVNNLITSVNDLLGAIDQQSTFDNKTYETGVLFGDSVARNVKDAVRGLLFTDSPGVPGAVKNLAAIGVGLNESGRVELDDATFQKALERDPDGVAALFQAIGKGSTTDLKYVSATNTAKASSGEGYPVNVTQASTRGSFVAGTAQTGPRTVAETLTFKGSAFGTTGISVDMESGSDLAATVAKINADGRLKELISASIEDGKLRIDAKRYGTAGNFTLASNHESSGTNSGVGAGGEGTLVTGVDVQGTINGEPTTGNGQFMTGMTGNSTTEGLQVQAAGNRTGLVGTIAYSRGAASRMMDLISSFNDSTKGSMSASDKSLQDQIDSLDKDMTTIDDRITSKKAELAKRFAAMEDAISKLKAKGSSLSSLIGTSNSS